GAPAAQVADHLVEQQVAEATTLEVGADDDRELRLDVVRGGSGADDAERLLVSVGIRAHGDERHLPRVVDLRQARELAARQLAARVEEAQAQVAPRELLR